MKLFLVILSLTTTIVSASLTMNSVYGIKPGDPDYQFYNDNDDKTPKTPYENLIINGCLKEPFYKVNKTITMDTKGLDELGLDLIDKNICFEYAKYIAGYFIDSVETDKNGDMIITLTKK